MATNEADVLERKADLLMRQAKEREDNLLMHGGGSVSYYRSLDTVQRYRRQARELREKAVRLRG